MQHCGCSKFRFAGQLLQFIPDLARRYRVSSVPKTVVGEAEEFVGAQPEAALLLHVQKAADTAALS